MDAEQAAAATRRTVDDINKLLTVIRVMADFVESTLAGSGLPTAEIHEIRAAADRVRKLTSELISARRASPAAAPGRVDASALRCAAAALPETILVVDDDVALRPLARRILAGQGYRVLEARDGAEALRIAAGETRIDLVLTDVEMPTLSGPGMAAELRETNPGTRILFMSGFPVHDLVRKGLDAGLDGLLAKPFSGVELLAAVRKAVGGPTV